MTPLPFTVVIGHVMGFMIMMYIFVSMIEQIAEDLK